MKRILCRTLLGSALALAPLPAIAQQGGTITGRILDAASQRPLSDAQVRVVGTPRGGISNENGEYRITAVAPGTYQLRAQRIGYAPVTQSVTVTLGESVTANFTLAATAIQIDQVVVTATGETQRKRETGNSVATIEPQPARLATSTTIADVLQAQAPGVYVAPAGGTQGGANRIRIRGANSASLSNEPLIIIDGVRANNDIAGTGTIGVGGQQSSRLNDLNPDDIESMEVLKGPAAAAMYGTAAANGVIQIRTKRGKASKPKWNVHAEGGQQKDITDWPANFTQIGTINSSGARRTGCTLDLQAQKNCTAKADSLVSWNPLVQASPFITGGTESYGANVSGGGDVASYFVSGVFDRNQGVYDWNTFRRTSLRANLTGQFRDNITAQISSAYASSRLRLPQNDNNTLGVIGSALLGSAFDNPVSRGYLAGQPPEQIAAIDTRESVERFISSANVTWQINRWVTANGTAGVDFFDRRNRETTPPNKVFFGSLPEGARTANTADVWNYTASGGINASFDVTPSLRSSTIANVQFNKDLVAGVRAFGAKLLAGTGSLQGTAARFSVGETNTDNKQIGGILQEQLAFKDRLFLAVGVRTDNNSAFGADFGWIAYPSASLSYVISDEAFFPKNDVLTSLRLRTAYGKAGQRPTFRDAITYYNAQSVTVAGTDVPGIQVGGTGNAALRPEVSREFEGGFEAGFLNSRIALEATYYNKRTNDLLISRPLPPSLGLTTSQYANLGQSSNKGLELLLRGQVVDTRNVKFDITATAATNENRLEALGKLPTGGPIPAIVFGRQRHTEGYPLGGFWDKRITYSDKNGDGIISRVNCAGQTQVVGGPECEITLSDTAVYMGNPLPKNEWTLSPRLQLFSWLQVGALLDHKGGFMQYNNTARFRCNFGNCIEAYDKSSSLYLQARNLGQLMGTDAGYMEDATFTKLREVSVTLTAPRSLASRVKADGVSLTLAGRNLATWTKYTGFDPELNSTPAAANNFATSDFLTQPLLRMFTARLSVAF